MDIHSMHEVFRTLTQQMGLQLVRGILPESVDTFINMEINSFVRNKLLEISVLESQNDVNLQSVSTNPLNAFRTLFNKDIIELNNDFYKDGVYTLNQSLLSVNPMYYIGFAIVTKNNKTVKCRIIEPNLVETTFNDYCNKPDVNNPIVTFYKNNGDSLIKLYTNSDIKSLIIDYIKYPNKVSLNGNVNCDLPEYLHYDIVEGAVKRFNMATNKISNAQKQ